MIALKRPHSRLLFLQIVMWRYFMKLFQVVLDGKATKFTFTDKVELVDKMVELQEQFPKAKVTFLVVDL
jgi:hypothetical protein